jgi:polar amino acid transport system substrate-binding protein
MERILALFGLLTFGVALVAYQPFALADDIQIVTEEYPPYNYQEDQEIKGVSTEVVKAVLREVGIQAEIMLYPWARAYHTAQHEKNTLIYSISRTPNREALFKWVGVIAPIEFYIFASKERPDIKIQTLEDAKQYQIAVVREDALDQFFTQQGFPNLYRLNHNEAAMKMVLTQRAELWPISEYAGYYFLQKQHHSISDVRKVFRIEGFASGDQYMAFSPSTPDELVNKFRTGLQSIKDQGIYQQILDDYFK